MQLLTHALTLEARMSDYIPQKVMDLIIYPRSKHSYTMSINFAYPRWRDRGIDYVWYKNNAWVTVNNDFGSRVRRFTN